MGQNKFSFVADSSYKGSLTVNTKKILSISLLLAITILISLGGFWQPASAKSGVYRLVEDQTIGLGNQGIHVSNIPFRVSHVYLDNVGTHLPSHFSHKMDMRYRPPALEVRFMNTKGDEVMLISALVYVYFNIGRAERDLWFKSGMEKIAVWFASQETGKWELCPTYFVNQSPRDGTVGRLACLAPGSGYYVLGQGDFSGYLLKPNAVNVSNPQPTTLKVRAFVDGRSQLIIQGNTIYWHHFDFEAPGRWRFGGGSKPTYLNQSVWEPTWPDIPDSTNEFCDCDSSSYYCFPYLASKKQSVLLQVVEGRGSVHIVQQPDTDNDFTLIIELDDNPLEGADWYEVNLTYTVEISE